MMHYFKKGNVDTLLLLLLCVCQLVKKKCRMEGANNIDVIVIKKNEKKEIYFEICQKLIVILNKQRRTMTEC